MKANRRIKLLVTLLALGLFGNASSRAVEQQPDLAAQAVAILQAHCASCHGADKTSGLDLRTRDGLLAGGARGTSVKPGDAAASLLYRYVTGQEKPRMPLGGELDAKEIDVLKRWIDNGAPWPMGANTFASLFQKRAAPKPFTAEQRNYWAFRTPVRAPLPEVKNRAWIKTPIDAFVLAKLEAAGLAPSPAADKRTLLRRVTFDVTGLPPTPAEIDAFLKDQSPDAYAKVVKRLLASPRYGERWAQHWLDVVRFGETNGFELDAERPQSWRYRDYVIRALNEDRPYERFITEQLAGDELDPNNFELRVATGFLRGGPQHVVAGNQDEAVNRQEWLTEVMFGVGNGLMGLTVGCARCHDHKFDPIRQSDFYRLQAFFAAADNTEFKRPTKEEEAAHAEAAKAFKAKLKPIEDQIKAIEKPYEQRLSDAKRAKLEPHYARVLEKKPEARSEEEKRLAKDAMRMIDVNWDELVPALSPADRARRAELRRQMHQLELYAPAALPAALAVTDKLAPVPTMRLLKGGDPHRPGDEMTPQFPSVLLPPNQTEAGRDAAEVKPIEVGEFKSTGRRLALARWLAQPDHPLTGRVMMNRLWHYHFGRGIVATPNDFGRNGAGASHPELLDWLAVEFVARGWSLKQMHELMLLSNTYQQVSTVDAAKAKIDPDNKLLWRANRQRLDAESLRDSVIATAGTLTEQLYGPSVKVPLEPEVYDTIFTEAEPDNLWPVHPDARQHTRRSLYLIRKRNVRLPLLVAFDAPDMMNSCGARAVSVHALQSLTLLNSEFMLQQSRALATRLFREAGGDERGMIDRLFQLTLARRPSVAEAQYTRAFLRDQTAILQQRLARGEPVAQLDGLASPVNRAQAAAWVDLCLATFNLNEFVYVN